ncbi:MAG: hypothetical protein E7402_02455 [Ruminococcaceae bacterium]|nr:hypothetical protein [Oscillospiraceae bacterium]
MRQLWTTVNVQQTDNGERFALDYYVLAKEVGIEGQRALRYGVEIYKRGTRPDGTPYAAYRKIFDVFSTEQEAREVLSLMARNTVTPITMQDILEDMLGIREFAWEARSEDSQEVIQSA